METGLYKNTIIARLTLVLALLVVAVTGQAQMINFKFKIKEVKEEVQANGKSIKMENDVNSGLEVFTFGVEARARNAAKRFIEGYEIKKGEGDCYDQKKAKGGVANNVKGDTRGYAVLTVAGSKSDTAIVIPIAKYYEESTNTVTYSDVIDGGKVLKTVQKSGKQKARGDKQGSARIYGNKVVVKGQIRLDSAYTRDDARFVGAPRLMTFMVADGGGIDTLPRRGTL